MRKLVFKRCRKCNTLIHVVRNEENDSIICCGEEMEEVESNIVDAAIEKHLPTYEKESGDICVTVHHVMEENHFIEWICLVTEEKEEFIYFTPKQKEAKCRFVDCTKGTLYAYCNQHGLWKQEISD